MEWQRCYETEMITWNFHRRPIVRFSVELKYPHFKPDHQHKYVYLEPWFLFFFFFTINQQLKTFFLRQTLNLFKKKTRQTIPFRSSKKKNENLERRDQIY